MDWSLHVAKLELEGALAFLPMYGMSIISFTKLCVLLEPHLNIDAKMSTRQTNKEIIYVEIIVSSVLNGYEVVHTWTSGQLLV
jgi:hypothetical protein